MLPIKYEKKANLPGLSEGINEGVKDILASAGGRLAREAAVYGGTGALLGGLRKGHTAGHGALTGLSTGAGATVGAAAGRLGGKVLGAGANPKQKALWMALSTLVGTGAGASTGFNLMAQKPTAIQKLKHNLRNKLAALNTVKQQAQRLLKIREEAKKIKKPKPVPAVDGHKLAALRSMQGSMQGLMKGLRFGKGVPRSSFKGLTSPASTLLSKMRTTPAIPPRRVSSALGYYKGANDHAFQLGVAAYLKSAGVSAEVEPRLHASILGFHKQAAPALALAAGRFALPWLARGASAIGRFFGGASNLAGKAVGGVSRMAGHGVNNFARGVGMGGRSSPEAMRKAMLWMRRNPGTVGATAIGAGMYGMSGSDKSQQPKLPSGQPMPQGMYGMSEGMYPGMARPYGNMY